MQKAHVVAAFLRDCGEVLLLRRSDEVGSHPGRWSGVTGHAEGDPDSVVRKEIRSETGLESEDVTLVRAGDSFAVENREGGRDRVVHPYLFDAATREVTTNWEATEYEWVPPTAIRRRETVPDLWRSYEHVSPTVETIETDRERGSAALSVEALEALRDRAGVLADRSENESNGREPNDRQESGERDGGGWDELVSLARDLHDARPSMVVIGNRVNRVMAEVAERTPSAVERTTQDAIERAATADGDAAAVAAEQLTELVSSTDGGTGDDVGRDGEPTAAGPRVVTLSRSGTVIETLRRMEPAPREVVIAESRPGGEGRAVAEELRSEHRVTLVADAGVAHALGDGERGIDGSERGIDAVLVGADTVYPDGSVLNKVGTRGAAIAAGYEKIPVYVVAASAKISFGTPSEPALEPGDASELYSGDADVEVRTPTFDVTPGEVVTGICTERGVLAPEAVASVAEEFAALAGWDEG